MRDRFGEGAVRGYRLAYNIFAVLTLIPILMLPVLLPDQNLYVIPFPWILLTVFIQLLALSALLIGLLHTGFWSFLGLRQLITSEPDKPEKMIVRGLYQWVRHPLYTAGLVFIWLIPRMTVNLLALNIGLSAYLVIGAYVEERKLLQTFGDDYRDYQERVPMIIPRPSGKVKKHNR